MSFPVASLIRDKCRTDLLFNEPILSNYRPKAKAYPKKYSSSLAEGIINDFKCDNFVIKPISSGGSNGIIFADKYNLDDFLKRILNKNNNESDKQTAYWRGDKEGRFLIEEFDLNDQ